MYLETKSTSYCETSNLKSHNPQIYAALLPIYLEILRPK